MIIIICSFIYFGYIVYLSSFYESFNERLNEQYIKTVIMNFIISIFMFVFIYSTSNLTIGFPLLKNIIITLLATDTIYYWSHYISHKIPFIKKYMHSTHHNLSGLLPLDTFYLDSLDHFIYGILVLFMPLLFVENNIEYAILIFISMIHSIYLHSDTSENFILPMFINSKYHTLHHKIGKGNYSIFFSFWDDYMETRVKELPAIEKTTNMSLDEFNKKCLDGEKLTIINGKIINCKTWIDMHPGGKTVIKNLIGKDSTDDFNKIHGDSKVAKEMLETLQIADLSN